jgi:asparagine synthase (glutamine-hydrolysing)
MCGIAGCFSVDATAAKRIYAMVAAQVHRGPDDQGVEICSEANGVLALAHRRLSIIDLSDAGHQPMRHPETHDIIIFNGEIYNFQLLREELRAQGTEFIGHSDTEVVLHAFVRWGTACFNRLCGMFALSIYQPSRRRLILARDPMGIKPLYYTLRRDGFAFASELRALRCSGLVAGRLDERGMAGFLAYGAVQEPLTLLEGARMLPAGTWIELDLSVPLPSELHPIQHWTFPVPARSANRSKARDRVRELLEQSVRRHLISDVPVGVFLSSGLDSFALAALAVESKPNVQTFTVSLGDELGSEGPEALETACELGTVHHTLHLHDEEMLRRSGEYFDALDQPTIDGLNTYLIAAAVRDRGIKVALSGLGGDELFGGYASVSRLVAWLPWARRISRLPHALRRRLAPYLARPIPIPQRYKAIDMMLCEPSTLAVGLQRRRLFSGTELRRFDLPLQGLELTEGFQVPGYCSQAEWYDNDPAAAMSVVESMAYMRNMLLRDTDVFGMVHGLEIRVPLLDRDLIDFVYGLPGALRVPRNGINKPLLVEAIGDRLPKKLAVRPKRGFNVMQEKWLRGPMKDLAEQGLEAASSVLGRDCIQQLWRDFLLGNHRLWSRIWACVTLGVFIVRLSDRDEAAKP